MIANVLLGPYGPEAVYRRVRITSIADANKLRGAVPKTVLVIWAKHRGRTSPIRTYLQRDILDPMRERGTLIEYASSW